MTIDYNQALALVKKKDKLTPNNIQKSFGNYGNLKRKERIEKMNRHLRRSYFKKIKDFS